MQITAKSKLTWSSFLENFFTKEKNLFFIKLMTIRQFFIHLIKQWKYIFLIQKQLIWHILKFMSVLMLYLGEDNSEMSSSLTFLSHPKWVCGCMWNSKCVYLEGASALWASKEWVGWMVRVVWIFFLPHQITGHTKPEKSPQCFYLIVVHRPAL